MATETHTTVATTTDNVRIRVFDAAEAPTPEAARDAEPLVDVTEHNTTRPAYHETIIGGLNGTAADLEVDVLALGDDSSASVADDVVLGNETFRTALTDTIRDGQSFTAIVFLDSTEANGASYFEAALVAETGSGDVPINRTVFDDPEGRLDPKTEDVTATIEVEITQQDGA